MAHSEQDGGIINAMQDAEDATQRELAAEEKKTQDKALIQKWAEKVKRARTHDRHARARWANDRRTARGDPSPDAAPWLVTTNLIASIMEVLAAFLYARNPDVSIKPSPSANRKLITEFRAISETLEIMISRMLKDAGLKRVAKRWVRGAMTVGISWIKCAMQTGTRRDPLTTEKINDLQDNLRTIEAKQKSLDDGDVDDEDSTAAEIRSQITALEGQMEREVAVGLVLDIMAPEDVVVAPDVGEIENYVQAPWISFDLYKNQDEALAITGWDLKDLQQANLYTQRPRKGETDEGSANTNSTQWVTLDDEESKGAENVDGFYRFMEIWSLSDGVVYTAVEGIAERWARAPYAPRTGARFYPAFALAFHYIDGERYPQSDVHQLTSLQEEYSRTRSGFAEHRRRVVPAIVFNKKEVTETSIQDLAKAKTMEYVGIDMVRQGADMNQAFAPKKYAAIDPSLYDTLPITTDMEKVSGAQDAVQGGVLVEKTATEAQIQESGRGARTGARLDSLEDALTELSEYGVQLILQTMSRDDAVRYAGPEAVWLDMSTDEALTLFNIEIKAGSTGKPKVNTDREAWATLMPLLEGMIDRIGQARMQGQEWAAKPWIALLEESANRLDDFADLEQFLPVPPPEVVQAMKNPSPSEDELAKLRNIDSGTLKNLAETLEKNPLFVGPAVQIVSELAAEAPAPNVPASEELPPAPNPI